MKKQTQLAFLVLLLALCGCGSPGVRPDVRTTASSATSITVSPTSAAAGSPDLLLTITGSNFAGARHNFSQAVWSSNGGESGLATTFVSSTQLTAVVPASLLASPVAAQVSVQTGDPMGDLPLLKSGPVGFSVTALPVGAATITSISPESAPAGGSDVTVTIEGSNFDNQRFHTSVAFWTTDPGNLHDSGTMLDTTFVSSSQLLAVIPADLLQKPVSVRVVVLTGDVMGMSDGFFGYPMTNSVTFAVGP